MRKKLKFEIKPMRRKWPVFAIGFMAGGKEFLVVLWLIDFSISWGY